MTESDTDLGWVSAWQALQWGIRRLGSVDGAKREIARHIRDGELKVRYKVRVSGSYLYGVSRYVPIIKYGKKGTNYATMIDEAKGYGAIVAKQFWNMSIDWDADVKRWIWERGVFHLVTGAGDERTDPQFMAFYDVQLSVSELERVNIADKVLPQVQADTGRGRRISDVYGLWMAELCHHILVNGSPDPSRVGATIDDVNVAIGVHRERYPDTTENYREVSRSSIVDHATAVIKLMHARDVLGKPYP